MGKKVSSFRLVFKHSTAFFNDKVEMEVTKISKSEIWLNTFFDSTVLDRRFMIRIPHGQAIQMAKFILEEE